VTREWPRTKDEDWEEFDTDDTYDTDVDSEEGNAEVSKRDTGESYSRTSDLSDCVGDYLT
jgi:hypothetical protein